MSACWVTAMVTHSVVNDKFHLLDVGLKHLLVIFQEEYQTRLQAPKLAAKEQSIL